MAAAVEPREFRRGRKVLDERRGAAVRRPRRPWSVPAALASPHAIRDSPRRPPPRRAPAFANEHGRGTYAALDLGTNNCRLLIARPTARRLSRRRRVLAHHPSRAKGSRLRAASARRRSSARSRRSLVCRDKMRARGVPRARLIATEACRAAENGEEFRARVAEEAGLELEIVDSATEARLAAAGCTELFDPAASGVILFDIGGGSSEVVRLGRPNGASPRAAAARYRRLGVAAGRRRHACRALRRHRGAARNLRCDGRRGRRASWRNLRRRTAATSTVSTCLARPARSRRSPACISEAYGATIAGASTAVGCPTIRCRAWSAS